MTETKKTRLLAQKSLSSSWASKYPPLDADEYIFPDQHTKDLIMGFIDSGNIPGHLLLLGSTGIGKSSFVRMIKSIYERTTIGRPNPPMNIEKLDIAAIEQMQKLVGYITTNKKLVFIEELEVKRMHTDRFLGELKLLIDRVEFQQVASVVATSNSLQGFEDAMKNRFTIIKLDNEKSDFKTPQIHRRFSEILVNENITFTPELLTQFIEQFPYYDIRKMLNTLYDMTVTGALVIGEFGEISSGSDVATDEDRIAKGNVAIYKSLLKYKHEDLVQLYHGRMSDSSPIKKSYDGIMLKMFDLCSKNPMIRPTAIIDLMLDKNVYPELGPIATINLINEAVELTKYDMLLHKYALMKLPSIMLKSVVNEL